VQLRQWSWYLKEDYQNWLYNFSCLKQRHFPFKVNQQVRDQWVFCMRKALYEIAMPDEFRKNIKQAIADLATHMINC
jgi:hemoglobin